jgi:hypothetical protein
MKRRFRQKQEIAPEDDPEKVEELSEDRAGDNVDINEIIKEIDTHVKPPEHERPS